MPASAAEYDQFVEFLFRPNGCRVLCNLIVTQMTWKPSPTALEFDRNDVVCAVIMRTACFRIDIAAADLDTVDRAGHAPAFCRGQISTSNEPMIQHAIIIMKPVLNEPVR